MREYNYKKIDAFTSGKSSGNPAACIYLEDNQALSDDEMLRIARPACIFCLTGTQKLYILYE